MRLLFEGWEIRGVRALLEMRARQDLCWEEWESDNTLEGLTESTGKG